MGDQSGGPDATGWGWGRGVGDCARLGDSGNVQSDAIVWTAIAGIGMRGVRSYTSRPCRGNEEKRTDGRYVHGSG